MEFSEKICKFIDKFKEYDQNDVIVKTFMNGQCYWFAVILAERFSGGQILYEPIEGYFVTKIVGRYYDIRGDVTELYEGATFYDEKQCFEMDSILRGCMLKED